MAIKIFYSWQSDLPNSTNRGFIGNALDNIAKSINGNIESAERPGDEIEIDTATKNIMGTVNIADTILHKIDECDVFVGDVSIVGTIDSYNKGTKEKRKTRRKTPNPNVLFELGYAWKKLGKEKIITVMNTAHAKFEDLPFDLRGKTIISYSITKDVEVKANERKKLEENLEKAIRLIIEKSNFQEESSTGSQPENSEDTVLLDIQNLAAQKGLEVFRRKWLQSNEGLEDVINSVNEAFSIIEEEYSSNEENFTTLEIEFYREKHSRLLCNRNFGCQIVLKGYDELQHHNESLSTIYLEITIFKKTPLRQDRNLFTTEAIEIISLRPNINMERQVIWEDKKDGYFKYTQEQVCKKYFDLLLKQLKNPPKSTSGFIQMEFSPI